MGKMKELFIEQTEQEIDSGTLNPSEFQHFRNVCLDEYIHYLEHCIVGDYSLCSIKIKDKIFYYEDYLYSIKSNIPKKHKNKFKTIMTSDIKEDLKLYAKTKNINYLNILIGVNIIRRYFTTNMTFEKFNNIYDTLKEEEDTK